MNFRSFSKVIGSDLLIIFLFNLNKTEYHYYGTSKMLIIVMKVEIKDIPASLLFRPILIELSQRQDLSKIQQPFLNSSSRQLQLLASHINRYIL